MTWITEYRRWLSESESLQNAQKVADFLGNLGWSKEAISATCGNMRVESSINPDMYEFGKSWEGDWGYGLVQWTPRSKYWNWATGRGLAPRSGDSQLARIEYEQKNGIQWIATSNYPESFNQYTTSTKSIEYLTNAFCWNYERPNAEAGQQSMPERIAFAKRVFNEIDFSGSGSGGGDGSGRQLAVLPIDYVDVSQGEYGSFSHYEGSGQELAIDFVFPTNQYPLYAPFDIEVMLRNDDYATVVWKNTRPVMGADGTPHDELHIIVLHDDNWTRWKVGQRVSKGEHFGNSGNATGGSGTSTGDHFHFEVMKGHSYSFPPVRSNQLHIYDVFDTKHVKTWLRDGGYNWLESDYRDGSDGGTGNSNNMIIQLLLSGAMAGW